MMEGKQIRIQTRVDRGTDVDHLKLKVRYKVFNKNQPADLRINTRLRRSSTLAFWIFGLANP